MGTRNLDKVLRPSRVALLGSCEPRSRLGPSVLRNLVAGGYKGVIYPVQPTCESIQGIATYPNLTGLPHRPDLAVICNPAEQVAETVRDCGEAGIPGVLILSSGFRESGTAGRCLEDEVGATAQRFAGMRILGPNSLGIINPKIGLNASHAVTMPKPGRLAFVSESRALCNSVIDWAVEAGIGFSTFVSTGNRLDVDFGDLIDYFRTDPDTRAIILYIQSIRNARRFISAARALARMKPVVVYKAGRFAESAEAVASHTGWLVGEDAVYDAAFERCGVVRVSELDDVFDVSEVLASQRLPTGSRLAIISNAGGPAIIATDSLIGRGGRLAGLSTESIEHLRAILPPTAGLRNPVDLLDNAPPQRYAQALPVVLDDPQVDAVLVIFATQSGSDPAATAAAVVAAAGSTGKPVLAAWMGGARMHEGIRLLNHAGLPAHPTPEQAIRAFMHLVSYAHNLELLYETPREIPLRFNINRRKLRTRLQPLLSRNRPFVTERQAKAVLKAYDIPVCDCCCACTEEEAVRVAQRIGYPVVLKLDSPQVRHKVDVGGVALDLRRARDVRAAYAQIVEGARRRCRGAVIHGVTIQKMIAAPDGLELILGATKDRTFGTVIVVGMGGVATNLLHDRAIGLPPLNERLTLNMLRSLRVWPILEGFRGQPPLPLEKLIEVIIRFSMLIADYPQIQELEINPLLLNPEGVLALDAVMMLDPHSRQQDQEPFPHLAIRPYPEEYLRHARSAGGDRVTLRIMRAEDEPLWHGLIASSSAASIRSRFRSMFLESTHEMAVNHCVLDYERQIAIVAETSARGFREFAGVAQLVADENHETAELAVLISDPWQGKRIGGLLLDHCIALAKDWGLCRIVAETGPDNIRMLTMLRKRGFSADFHLEEDVVMLERCVDGGPAPEQARDQVPAVCRRRFEAPPEEEDPATPPRRCPIRT